MGLALRGRYIANEAVLLAKAAKVTNTAREAVVCAGTARWAAGRCPDEGGDA